MSSEISPTEGESLRHERRRIFEVFREMGSQRGLSSASNVVNGMGPVLIRSRILGKQLSRFTVFVRMITGAQGAVVCLISGN